MEKVITIVTIIIIVVVFGILLFSLGSYLNYGVKQGIIVDKQYQSEHTYTTYTTSYVGNDTIRIPHQNYVGDTYRIKLQKNEDGKQKTCWIEVTEQEYNDLNIGDSYGGYREE